jgi:hypothetical protein
VTTDTHRLRQLAQQCRVVAETMQSVVLRRQVLDIADSYDHMAQVADERAAREKSEP